MKHSSIHNADFPETRWTWVVQAGQSGDGPAALRALELLCQAYWRPVYAFLRRHGHSVHDAEDFTQGFFEDLFESPFFQSASPELGKFRTYLLGALKKFVAKDLRARRAIKRGGGRSPLSLDLANAESYLAAATVQGEPPDRAFDRQWALNLLDATIARLEERYRNSRQEAFFEAMKSRLVGVPDGRTIAEIAEGLGMDENAAKVAFHRIKRRYRSALREEVARTIEDGGDVEEELRYLITLFSGM
jgi:RNA polymerase sigma factor (sigma-70 family)